VGAIEANHPRKRGAPPERMYNGCTKDVRARAIPGCSVSFEFFTIGSGPGIRTLNLAVNSRLLYR
jgi:hypothetical protein